ncbi:alpha/beta fold hydrolase [Nonomuraea typhae]|uniref:Alpha/beta fold hydrolase n=1 Tax=Nonomuraea typhae TaxID=2603600 RepID=A0ABW7Z9U2_9ACTN
MALLKRSIAALGLTALASAGYQIWSSRQDRRRYPPPGRLVDVGGRRIHLLEAGSGAPTVVIVPALGTSSVEYAPLLPAVGREAATVVFDRAGLGWSDPVRLRPLALLDAAADLHTVLAMAGYGPPYILVGHSMGGYVVRLFAAAHPDEVAGVVLVDSSHHDQASRYPDYHWKTVKAAAVDLARPYGVWRMAIAMGLADGPGHLVLGSRPRATSWWENALRARIGFEVGRRAPTLGDIPLTVVTCSERNPDNATPRQAADFSRHYRIWYPLQRDLLRLSSTSRHVVAENAGHYVHRSRPDVVARAILDHVKGAGPL